MIQDQTQGKHTVFAKKAGIPVSTFQSYLSERLPHPEHLMRICETYRVNLNWLMTGQGARYRHLDEVRQNPPDYTVIKLDTTLLAGIIRAVEEGLSTLQAELSAEKKGQLVALLYEMHAEGRKPIDPQMIERGLQLAL